MRIILILCFLAFGQTALSEEASNILSSLGKEPLFIQNLIEKRGGKCTKVKPPKEIRTGNRLLDYKSYVPDALSTKTFPFFSSVSCNLFDTELTIILSGNASDNYRVLRVDVEYRSMKVAEKFLSQQTNQKSNSNFLSYSAKDEEMTIQRTLLDQIGLFSLELECIRTWGIHYEQPISRHYPNHTCSILVSSQGDILVIKRLSFKKSFFKKTLKENTSMSLISNDYFTELGEIEGKKITIREQRLEALEKRTKDKNEAIEFLTLD